MTDKEQALVAAAYRVAAGRCDKLCDEMWSIYKRAPADDPRRGDQYYQGLSNGADDCSDAIKNLTPADAENHLRALMMEVAITMLNKMYGERVWIEEPLRQIVAEVLNATK